MKSAAEVIEGLSLKPLPGEGGMWAPIFNNGAASAIYFLMEKPDFSAWHRIPEQEMWIHVAGSATKLYTASASKKVTCRLLDNSTPSLQTIVEPGQWMAAQPAGPWSLVICTLSPAFTSMELASRELVNSFEVEPGMIEEVRALLHD